MARILLLNGPNLNLLGSREPDLYGTATLADVEAGLRRVAQARGHELLALQSNSEQVLLDKVHASRNEGVAFAIVNAGAFSHTSIALRDALLGVKLPFIEVHVTNVAAREAFRHHSYLSDIAVGCIVGLGTQGYEFALEAACSRLAKS